MIKFNIQRIVLSKRKLA